METDWQPWNGGEPYEPPVDWDGSNVMLRSGKLGRPGYWSWNADHPEYDIVGYRGLSPELLKKRIAYADLIAVLRERNRHSSTSNPVEWEIATAEAISEKGPAPAVGTMSKALASRLAIYRMKLEQADPFAEESYNKREALNYVVEALELLAVECGLEGAATSGSPACPLPR
jgi:hypothetical protein